MSSWELAVDWVFQRGSFSLYLSIGGSVYTVTAWSVWPDYLFVEFTDALVGKSGNWMEPEACTFYM